MANPPDPLNPLQQLADTTNLTDTTTDDLYTRDQAIKDTLNRIPNLQRDLAQARQAIAAELRNNRQQSWGAMAKGYGVSRTRAQQMVSGDSANASQRRARADTEAEQPEDS